MKIPTVTTALALLAFVLMACGQEERAGANEGDGAPPGEQPPSTEGLVFVGGFAIEGPGDTEIVVPEATVSREAVEDYADEVRPVLKDTLQDLSVVVDPQARVEDDSLQLSIGLESIDEAKDATGDGLERLREIEPPEEELEPIHEQLVTAYEEALPAYENITEAFDSGDVDVLARAVRESLPEVERSIVKSRTILQELRRATNQPVPAAQDE